MNYQIDECYALIGPWIIKAQMPSWQHPHATTLCLSELGREKPSEIILNHSPCLEFDETPPCCYSLINSCSNILMVGHIHPSFETVKFLRTFVSVGWMESRPMLSIPYNNNLRPSIKPIGSNSNQKIITWTPKSTSQTSKTIKDLTIIKPDTTKLTIGFNKLMLTNLGFNIKTTVHNLSPLECPIAKHLIKRLHLPPSSKAIMNKINFVFLPDKNQLLFEINLIWPLQPNTLNILMYLLNKTTSNLILNRDHYINKYLSNLNKTIYLTCDPKHHNLWPKQPNNQPIKLLKPPQSKQNQQPKSPKSY
ncbi:Riboflavin biosynthesis protein RibD [Candidatus Hodgkinia cicadicola]|uniref:Riboflavin biosynthesis protein RibD n=1 Tax=Candidatus Hodgkinia cicadicola TaxID=573658 RepID=A0ABX4MGI6_9HYPH|nr:Riboflavin biosynthesis protein RibD [Candidatus Hodgkinia cicadicola]PIM95783.1 Riboflavin biosynthesis protein RibD [Candidatus Hodgkinia cicadicola]